LQWHLQHLLHLLHRLDTKPIWWSMVRVDTNSVIISELDFHWHWYSGSPLFTFYRFFGPF